MNTALANLLEVFLSLDKVVYNLIAVIYKLIVDLAEYQVFDAEDIEEFSNRVYALVGIFMLFKITFSMIVYLVNPDEFSDKSKGFGSLIKNVIISMVLIVAVPYIFNEAFYVQRMILHDGTIAKIVFGNGIKDSSTNIDQPGKELKFILFSQFVKPNSDDYAQLAVCDELFTYDADGKISNSEESTEEGEETSKTVKHHEINETCKNALKCAFDGNKEGDSCEETDNYLYYVKGMENSEFGLLTSDSDVFTYSANTKNKSQSNYKQPVIAYRWGVSTIIGIVVTLILITICLDVAVRSIKLGFYQIIAPIPILSNCDPKASKNGMLQKWAKACVETYLDLFIRLLGLFLGMKLIVALTDNTKFQGFASVVIVIGALMFAKQLPKILQDLTGLKLDGKFTLNPFKKIKNEIPEGISKGLEKARMRATGAAGGFLAGVVGGGNKFGEKMFSGALGTVRGAAIGKGFGAGLNAQADVNRKIRDARINGATFMGSVGAGLASTFGADGAELETRAKRLRETEDKIAAKRREIDEKNKPNDLKIKSNERKIAPIQSVIAKQKEFVSSADAADKTYTSYIEGHKAGAFSKQLDKLRGYQKQAANLKVGDTVGFDMPELGITADMTVTGDMLGQIENAAGNWSGKEGRNQLRELMYAHAMSHTYENMTDLTDASGAVIVNKADMQAYKTKLDEAESKRKIANEATVYYNDHGGEDGTPATEKIKLITQMHTGSGYHDLIGEVSNRTSYEQESISEILFENENLKRENQANEVDATIDYEDDKNGKTITGAKLIDVEQAVKTRKEEIERLKKEFSNNLENSKANTSHIFNNKN
ncbi:MAG: hypothetical protein IKN87_04375 [Bacilli bacterium]|nr:hypothetical protein [Bacilli bacterium]